MPKNVTLKSSVVALAFFTYTGAAFSATPPCVGSEVAERNIQMVEAWSKTVGGAAKLVGVMAEEAPNLELAALAVETVAEVTEVVAKLFAANQMGSPQAVDIPWNTITREGLLWDGSDGDTIIMKRTPGTGRLTFAQHNLTWWKGLVAFKKNNTNHWDEVACLQDDHKVTTLDFNPGIANEYYITLSKARTAGVHTNMYMINNWAAADMNYDYVFQWVKD